MKLVDCFPESPYYDGTEACVDYLTTYYGLDGELTAACEEAAISYFQCATALTCMELADLEGNSCADERAAAGQLCPN